MMSIEYIHASIDVLFYETWVFKKHEAEIRQKLESM